MRTGARLLEKGSNRLPREADDGGTEDYLNVPPIDITTRTRTRTNTNPNGTEANAADRSVRACVSFSS